MEVLIVLLQSHPKLYTIDPVKGHHQHWVGKYNHDNEQWGVEPEQKNSLNGSFNSLTTYNIIQRIT